MTTAEVLRDLFKQIEHGDDEHRKWLKDKIETYILEKNLDIDVQAEDIREFSKVYLNTILNSMEYSKGYLMRKILNSIKLLEGEYVRDSSQVELTDLEHLSWAIDKLIGITRHTVGTTHIEYDNNNNSETV